MKSIAILGGGPAAMSCALWLKNLKLKPVIFEKKSQLGGLQKIGNYHNPWLLGQHQKSNQEIIRDFIDHIEAEDMEIRFNSGLESINLDEFSALVLATGTRAQNAEAFAGIPGFEELNQEGKINFSFIEDFSSLKDKDLVIIGAGDNACEAAWNLAPYAASIKIFARTKVKAQQWQVEKINVAQNIEVIENATISSFEQPCGLVLDNGRTLQADLIIARTGFVPNTEEILQYFSALDLDSKGYIKTNPSTKQSSIEGVYAIGDLTNPISPCVLTALADGSIAARAIEQALRCKKLRPLVLN